MPHTPGPWTISAHGQFIRYRLGKTGGFSYNICAMEAFGGPPAEGLANAQLIATAPEMLETLERCENELIGATSYLATCDPATIVEMLDTFRTILAARLHAVQTVIRKAKGEL